MHTSETNVTKLAVQPMFLGKQRMNLQESRRLVIGSRCKCVDFCLFFVKTSATPTGRQWKKLVQQFKLQTNRFHALKQAKVFCQCIPSRSYTHLYLYTHIWSVFCTLKVDAYHSRGCSNGTFFFRLFCT